ncbi:hypothetical protein AK812_SmicGene39213 [Symbiodinium microadriaticum]|uniref:Uncharacterized protein n=1 Tax=Symbiodinium microadriaticum TaxID=2951 RepID=A0A1Q9CBR3_SYMMI|nr:hypothetical protein AK812_SmicGene39213 [Symbiodinium microadriaticum]
MGLSSSYRRRPDDVAHSREGRISECHDGDEEEQLFFEVSPHVVHSGSEDKLVVTYDLKQNKALVQHTSLGGNITNLSQRKDRDNEVVSCAQDGKLLFWDVDYPDPTGCIDSPTGMPLRLKLGSHWVPFIFPFWAPGSDGWVGCVHSPIPLFPMNQNHPALQPGGSDGCLFHALALAGQYLFTPQEFFNLPDETMQCFVEDASSGKVVAPEARLSAEAANRLGAAIGDPVVVIGREPKLKAAAKPKEVKEPKGKAAAKQKEVEVEAKVQPFTKFIGSPLFEYFTPASALLGNVAAVSVPRLLRRLFAHIHVADFGTVVAAGLGVFSHETPQGTVEERRHLQQVARELAADGDRAWLPSQLAAHLAGQGRAVTMNARTLRRQAAQMQGFRLVSNTGKNKRQTKAVTAPSDWQACVAANQDPDRGLLCFVSTPPSGSFVAVLPPLLDEVASIHAHGYLGPYSVSADCTFRVEIDDWVYLLVTASLHRMLDGRWRRSGLPVLFARHPVETNELYAVAFAALCTALDRRLEHFFRNLSEKTVRDLETGETIKVPMEHCWEERDVAAYLKRQYSVERRLNEAIYGWPAGLGVPLSPDEWSGVEWSGVEWSGRLKVAHQRDQSEGVSGPACLPRDLPRE